MVEQYKDWTPEQKIDEIQKLVEKLANLEYESRLLGPSLSLSLVEQEIFKTRTAIVWLNDSLKPGAEEPKKTSGPVTLRRKSRRAFYITATCFLVAFLATGAVLAAGITGLVMGIYFATSEPDEDDPEPDIHETAVAKW